jgi:hypothetical protein
MSSCACEGCSINARPRLLDHPARYDEDDNEQVAESQRHVIWFVLLQLAAVLALVTHPAPGELLAPAQIAEHAKCLLYIVV